MPRKTNFPSHLLDHENAWWFEDNFGYWNPAVPAPYTLSGSVAHTTDAPGNRIVIPSTGNNNEGMIRLTRKPLIFADGLPFLFRGRFGILEATSTGEVNAYFGVTDQATAANMVADNGGGLAATQVAAGFYAIDGSEILRCYVQNGAVGTRQEVELLANNANNHSGQDIKLSTANPRLLSVECKDGVAGKSEVSFHIDDVRVAWMEIDNASAVAMGPAAVCKSGSATAQDGHLEHWMLAQAVR